MIKIFKAGLPSNEGITLRPLSFLKWVCCIKKKYMNLSEDIWYASLESHSRRRPGQREQISDTEKELEERLSIFERYSTNNSLFQVTHIHACMCYA